MKENETVFLCGTDTCEDVFAVIYKALKRMKFSPLWFRSPDFPHLHPDAMENCLAVAESADRMVVVLDERAGLKHATTQRPISEAEYDICSARNIPILVFVRDKIWYQSKVYHRHMVNKKSVSPKDYGQLKLDGDQEVYALIERMQHNVINGSKQVPWIEHFALPQAIVDTIRDKWVLSRGSQSSVNLMPTDKILKSMLATLSGKKGKLETVRKVRYTNEGTSHLKKLDASTRKKLDAVLETLADTLEYDGPGGRMKPGVKMFKDVSRLWVNYARVYFHVEDDNTIVVSSIMIA